MHTNQFNLINFDPDLPKEVQMTPSEIKEQIDTMTPNEKAALANSMEIQDQDFPTV